MHIVQKLKVFGAFLHLDRLDRERDEKELKHSSNSSKKSAESCNLYDELTQQLSVNSQKCADAEAVICDSSSSDNRVLRQHLELLKQLESQPAKLYEKYFETENYRVCVLGWVKKKRKSERWGRQTEKKKRTSLFER